VLLALLITRCQHHHAQYHNRKVVLVVHGRIISVAQHQQPRVLQVSDAQECIVPGLRWDGEFLRNIQERSLGGARYADIDPKDSSESAQVSREIVRELGHLHVPKAVCEPEADLALPLAPHPRQNNATLRSNQWILRGVTENVI
jgi:hypothetical protein